MSGAHRSSTYERHRYDSDHRDRSRDRDRDRDRDRGRDRNRDRNRDKDRDRDREWDYGRRRDSPDRTRLRFTMPNTHVLHERESTTAAHRPTLASATSPSDEMEYEHSLVSDPPPVAKPSTTRTSGETDLALKQLVDLLSYRNVWWTQKDKAKKTLDQWEARIKNEPHRSEFASVAQLANVNKTASIALINKSNDKIENADRQIRPAFEAFLNSIERRKSHDLQEVSPPDPDPPKRLADLEARLARLEEPKRDVSDGQASNATALPSSHYDLQIEELKNRLFEESTRNSALEEQVKVLTSKLDTLCGNDTQTDQKIKELDAIVGAVKKNCEDTSKSLQESVRLYDARTASLVADLSEYSKTKVTRQDLDTILGKLEDLKSEVFAAIDSLRESLTHKDETGNELVKAAETVEKKLADFKAELPSLHDLHQVRKQMAELKVEVDSHAAVAKGQNPGEPESSVSTHPSQDATRLFPDLEDLKREVVASKQTTQQAIDSTVATEINKFKKQMEGTLTSVAVKFGQLIDSEATEREILATRLEGAESTTVSIQTEVQTLQGTLEEATKQIESLGLQHSGELATLRENVATAEGSIQEAKLETKRATDELSMQLHCLNAWQTQFSTKDLYKDIISHINETMPSGIARQVKTISGRLDDIEKAVQSGSEDTSKRRKGQNGMSILPQGP